MALCPATSSCCRRHRVTLSRKICPPVGNHSPLFLMTPLLRAAMSEPTTPPDSQGTILEAPRISACIVCRNEADRLKPCLESVAWADEIMVMDLSSTDNSA